MMAEGTYGMRHEKFGVAAVEAVDIVVEQLRPFIVLAFNVSKSSDTAPSKSKKEAKE